MTSESAVLVSIHFLPEKIIVVAEEPTPFDAARLAERLSTIPFLEKVNVQRSARWQTPDRYFYRASIAEPQSG